MVRVKVCGITNKEDASLAVDLGIHALGFIFAQSPRKISPEDVRDIIDTLPPFIQTVGVFVDEDLRNIRHIIDFCGLDMIQLHGNESPEFCEALMPSTIKTFRLKDASSLFPLRHYRRKVRAIALDTYQKGIKGGVGITFDWNLAVKGKDLGVPIILSGGLKPANIQKAISTVRPYAVDVNSGVEESPGKKSAILMRELMETIKLIDI